MAKARIVSEAERQMITARRNIEQIVERKKRTRERGERAGLWSRRDFFGRLSWGGLSAVSLVGVYAKCTHLGCTPRWIASENKYKCPCHGSGYYKSGYNFEGPAPRPMDRFALSLDENGEFVVDKSKVYTMQPGVEPDKQHPESILKV